MELEKLRKICKNKKLLILAGASVHTKLVDAANKLGVYTIVTDYLDDSPAKKISNESWNLNIMDVSSIVEKCREEKVDGVISGWIDPCQRPYCKICYDLNLPCLGTNEQFIKMTDKHAFKKMCIENDVKTIPEFSLDDCLNGQVDYPVFIKPVDSRGSRGQSVCRNYKELIDGIQNAKKESSNGDIIIEKYMENCHEFQVTYFFVNGDPYLIRTTDSYAGSEEDKLNKVVLCSVSPSKYTRLYLKKCDNLVKKMFKKVGIKNGPVFMQGFEKNGEFYFFDPGLRFPGVDYELMFKKIFNIDLMEYMIIYALTGEMPSLKLSNELVFMDDKYCAILFPTLAAGKIKNIDGLDYIISNNNVISYQPRFSENDIIEWCYNVNQRLSEIDILAETESDLIKLIMDIQNHLKVIDENDNSMLYGKFDVNRILKK